MQGGLPQVHSLPLGVRPQEQRVQRAPRVSVLEFTGIQSPGPSVAQQPLYSPDMASAVRRPRELDLVADDLDGDERDQRREGGAAEEAAAPECEHDRPGPGVQCRRDLASLSWVQGRVEVEVTEVTRRSAQHPEDGGH